MGVKGAMTTTSSSYPRVTGELWGSTTAQWDCVAVGWVSQCCEKFPDGDVRTAAGLLIDSAQREDAFVIWFSSFFR